MFYVPFYSTSLNFIFGSAELILPAKFASTKDNKIKDIQDIYPDYILVSKNRWIKECEVFTNENKKIDKCEVSIEIELTEEDQKRLYKLDENFYLFDMPIQLSKIKNIWFLNEEQMKQTISNIEMSQGFIPKELPKVDQNPKSIEFIKPKKKIKKPKDISKKVTLFRKQTGSLILAKNFLKKNNFVQYFDEVFSEIDPELKKIISERMVEKEDVEKIAKKENIELEYSYGIIKRKKIPANTLTYLFTMLYFHKPFMGCKLTGFYKDIKDNVSKQILDKYILIYGFMAGYNELSFKIINDAENFVFHRFENKKEDFNILNNIYKKLFKEKISRNNRLEQIKKLNLEEINIDELAKKFDISETTIKKDIREIFQIKKHKTIQKFLKKEKLKSILKEFKFSIKDISEKLKISEERVKIYLKEIKAEK